MHISVFSKEAGFLFRQRGEAKMQVKRFQNGKRWNSSTPKDHFNYSLFVFTNIFSSVKITSSKNILM
ncbi:MAG: hypothetical protein S4CHLAM123_06850 [Chlamydiales bacterium]|nr:hypothetical protein [Chlamydiales bacterium]